MLARRTDGVPAEILQGAARIAPEHASVNLAGPAQCVDQEDAGDSEAGKDASADTPQDAAANNAAVLDGGVDDLEPLQLWDTIMKKYKVAQVCTEELHRLERVGDDSDQSVLLRERALAVSTAVQALSKLHNEAVHKKLQELVVQEKQRNPST